MLTIIYLLLAIICWCLPRINSDIEILTSKNSKDILNKAMYIFIGCAIDSYIKDNFFSSPIYMY